MIKAFITFGSNQLQGFKVNPMKVMLYIEDATESELRDKIANTEEIGTAFCTSYPATEVTDMMEQYGMRLISLEQLMALKED